MSKRSFAIFAILALAALPALAKPDFTGDWKLNTSKSTFGDVPGPDSMTIKVAHAEPKLDTVSKQSGQMGEIEMKGSYTTDGKECLNHMGGDNEIKTTLKWDGDDLVGDSKGSFDGNEFTAKDRWTLSDGGKTMTVTRHISAGGADFDMKFVFEKQ